MADSKWNPKGSKDEVVRNKEIEKELREDKRRMDKEVKLLLLGAGESGKSTIAKQMKIIHLAGFTDKEKELFIKIIHNNVVQSMQDLIAGAALLKIGLDRPEIGERVAAQRPSGEVLYDRIPVPTYDMTPELARDIKTLWADSGIKGAYSRHNEFQLNDSAQYFLDGIDRVTTGNFAPDEQDMLRARVRTTGVHETKFVLDNVYFRIVDVGGQRGERAKWMSCFQDVTAVLFCVAMSEFDLKLREEESVNRMHESLHLFDEICNNRYFRDTPMLLFLNKKDIFEEKIQRIDLNVCFPDYVDGRNFDRASQFIRKKFIGVNQNNQKDVYTHVTVATDTKNIRVVFNAVKDIILNKTIKGLGVY